MNDDEVVVSEQEEQQASEQSSARPKQSLSERVDRLGDNINKTGKGLETFGKGEEKVADWIDGGEKAAKAGTQAASAASTVADKGTETAQKAAEAKGKAADATAKAAGATKQSARAAKAGARAGKAASKGTQAAGKGMKAAGSTPYTAALRVAGEGVDTAGKVGEGVSTGVEAGATAAEAGATAAETAAKAEAAASKAEAAALKSANAAAKASKAGAETAKKASDRTFADKLRANGKLNKLRGQRIQEMSKKFDSDELFDKYLGHLGKAGKLLKGIAKLFDPKTIAIVSLLFLTIGTLVISYILSPMFFMDTIRDSFSRGSLSKAANPDTIEKLNNYFSGLGFEDSKEAFYDEVEYLNIHYGKQLDFPYIMAALYYVDMYYSDVYDLSDDTDSKNVVGYSLAKYYLESSTTTGDDGLTYSANKLYRLRYLAKNQFLGEKQVLSLPLGEYIEKCINDMDNESKNLMKKIPFLIGYVLAGSLGLGDAYNVFLKNSNEASSISSLIGLLQGTETWTTVEMKMKSGNFGELITALYNFLSEFFGCFFNIQSIEFNFLSTKAANGEESLSSSSDEDENLNIFDYILRSVSDLAQKIEVATGNIKTVLGALSNPTDINKLSKLITINYYEYSYNKDEFENYLVDHYIREMPEFAKIIKDDEGKIVEDKVYEVAYEIKLTKEVFDNLYKLNESAQATNVCIGNVNLDLLSELTPPIDMTIGQTIKFAGSNNFGLYKGVVHNGVDLEDTSTGTKQGSKVYSVYEGSVISSTTDGTYPDKTVTGGWVVIEYTIQYEDSSAGNSKLGQKFKNVLSTIRVYYGGLDSNSLKLKQGDTVKKGAVIGTVGNASQSENGLKPSLHFAVFDVASNHFLNPINMFITCKREAKTTTKKLCGTTNEQKVWTYLTSKGYPKEAAAGIMGVWKRESGFKPYIVQKHSTSYSKSYTAKVDNGTISKKDFVKNGPGGNGYGLAQWTIPASRKSGLYDFAKKKGKSIGDLQLQLDYFEKEMKSKNYKNVRSKLMKVTTVEKATKIFLRDYEGGGSSSLKLRTSYAKDIYKKYKDYECK